MPPAVVDACCIINLYASGEMLNLLSALKRKVYLPRNIRNESLFIRTVDDQKPGVLVPTPLDLTDAIQAGLLSECDLQDGAEVELFVQLASTLDDGEAAALAIAKTRGCSLATDDRKAIRLARQVSVAVITTPEIVKAWVDDTHAADDVVAMVLKSIQDFARFIPRQESPLHGWWMARVGSK